MSERPREVDAADTPGSSVINDHYFIPDARYLCSYQYADGKCGLSEAAHRMGSAPDDDPGRPASMRDENFDHVADQKRVAAYLEDRKMEQRPPAISSEEIDARLGGERIFTSDRPTTPTGHVVEGAPVSKTPVKPPLDDPGPIPTAEPTREEILQQTGHKDDKGKNASFYIPHRAKQAVGNVMAFGAEKYSPGNYLLGMKGSRLWNAAGRHMDDWAMGKKVDEESGESPLANAACCLLMLLELEINGTLEDDRIDPGLFKR